MATSTEDKCTLLLTFENRTKRFTVNKSISGPDLGTAAARKFAISESQRFKMLIVCVPRPTDPAEHEKKKKEAQELIEKRAAEPFDLESQPFIIDCYDEQYREWIEADEEEPPKLELGAGVARIILKKEIQSPPTVRPPAPSVDAESTPIVQLPTSPDIEVDGPEEKSETPYYCSFLEDSSDEEDSSDGNAPGADPFGAAHAIVNFKKTWGKDKGKLLVYFMNKEVLVSEDWRCDGGRISSQLILAWARGAWNNIPGVPKFEETKFQDLGDIRVRFGVKKSEGCWSMVGKDAETKRKRHEPSMQLNLKGHPRQLQESLVIHEFGHALGLEHEHQRSDFWEAIHELIDVDKMKEDPRVLGSKSHKGKAGFDQQWERMKDKILRRKCVIKSTAYDPSSKKKPNRIKNDYDPESIMHYWFNVEWLADARHRNEKKYKTCEDLTTFQKDCLKAFHKRNDDRQLPEAPSDRDKQLLELVYGGSSGQDEEEDIV